MHLESKSVKHLRDIHRIGATCANIDGERLILWGGTIDTNNNNKTDDLAAKTRDVWIFDTLTETWRRKECRYAPDSNFELPTLAGSTSSIIGKQMFVFGGHSAEDHWLNSLYALDLDTFTWSDLGSNAHAKPTKPIRSDKNVSWTFGDKFYVFGGYGFSQTEHIPELMDKQKDLQLCPDHRWPKFGWNNQLVEYDPSTKTWSWPSYSGRCPSARAAHSGTLMGNIYYLFGGRDIRERLNDLYTLNMNSFEWSRIAIISNDVSPRQTIEQAPLRHLFEEEESDEEDRNSFLYERQQFLRVQLSRANSANSTQPSTTSEFDDEVAQPVDASGESYLVERWSLSLSNDRTATSSAEANACSLFGQDIDIDVDGESQELVEQQAELFAELHEDVDSNSNSNSQEQQQAEDSTPTNYSSQMQPVGRSFASFTPISADSILLYGGISSQEQNLDDCWTYSIKRNFWKQVELTSKKPRLWHAGMRTNEDQVILLAGSSGKIDNYCTDLLILNSSPNSLKKLAMKSIASLSEKQIITLETIKDLPETLKNIVTKSCFDANSTSVG